MINSKRKNSLEKASYLITKKFNLEPHVKTSVKQCFRCLEYGHLIADCTSSQCCTRCGGDHPHKDCPTDRNSPTCANCMKDEKISPERRNHAASDRSCPTRIRLLREARRLDLKNKKQFKFPSRDPMAQLRFRRADLSSPTSNRRATSASHPRLDLLRVCALLRQYHLFPKFPPLGK